jgi:hypothetical protein
MVKRTNKVNNVRREKIIKGLQVIGTLGLITLFPSFNKVTEVLPKEAAKNEPTKPTYAVWG